MATAGLRLLVHGQSLSVTDVVRLGSTVTVYSDTTLSTEATLPITVAADTTYYINEDTSGQQVTFTATQGDGTSISRTVFTNPHATVEVDLAPSQDQVTADASRVDSAISTAVSAAKTTRDITTLTTSSTITSTHLGKLLRVNTTADVTTISVPVTALGTGSTVELYQAGTGSVVVAGSGTASVLSFSSRTKVSGQYGAIRLVEKSPGAWLLTGDITTS